MVCPRQLQLQQRAVYRVLDNLRVNGFDEAAWRNALGQGIMTLFGATPVWWWVMTGGVCRPETELASEAVEQRIQEISPEADSEPYKTLNPRPRKLQRELGVRKLPGSGRPGELPGVPGGVVRLCDRLFGSWCGLSQSGLGPPLDLPRVLLGQMRGLMPPQVAVWHASSSVLLAYEQTSTYGIGLCAYQLGLSDFRCGLFLHPPGSSPAPGSPGSPGTPGTPEKPSGPPSGNSLGCSPNAYQLSHPARPDLQQTRQMARELIRGTNRMLMRGELGLKERGIGDLSPRECQTMGYLLEGASEKEIAKQMYLSPHTVHSYVKSLYRRFSVSSRSALMALFVHCPPQYNPRRHPRKCRGRGGLPSDEALGGGGGLA